MALVQWRLQAYHLGGAKVRVLKTSQASVQAIPYEGSLSFSVSRLVAENLPDYLEVGAEYWTGTAWVEPENARFVVTRAASDESDPAHIVRYLGIGIVKWYAQRAELHDELDNPLVNAPMEPGFDITFTTRANALYSYFNSDHRTEPGDRLECLATGGNPNLRVGSFYWVSAISATGVGVSVIRGGANVPTGGGVRTIRFRKLKQKISAPANTFKVGDAVQMNGTIGATSTFITGKTFWVITRTANSIRIGTVKGGDAWPSGNYVTHVSLQPIVDDVRKWVVETPGRFVLRALNEAKELRRWGPSLNWTFTRDVDSDGKPWRDPLYWPFDVRQTIDDVIGTFISAQYLTIHSQGRTVIARTGPVGGVGEPSMTTPYEYLRGEEVKVDDDFTDIATSVTIIDQDNPRLRITNGPAVSNIPAAVGTLEWSRKVERGTYYLTKQMVDAEIIARNGFSRQVTVSKTCEDTDMRLKVGDSVRVEIKGVVKAFFVQELAFVQDGKKWAMSIVLGDRHLVLTAWISKWINNIGLRTRGISAQQSSTKATITRVS